MSFLKVFSRENPIKNEKVLCDDIYKLIEGKRYRDFINKDYRILGITSKLKILYKQYEEKQKLYDEIDRIDVSKQELETNLNKNKKKTN